MKIEGGMEIVHTVEALTKAGIPVIAHTGLTPQKALQMGGYKTQGRDMLAAVELIKEVAAFEKAGAIAVVIEAIPSEVAKIIYERSNIPILGTGCGPYSDSPMINFYDMLGYYDRNPKFVKKYADVHKVAVDAVSQFVQECHDGTYPGPEHCYQDESGRGGEAEGAAEGAGPVNHTSQGRMSAHTGPDFFDWIFSGPRPVWGEDR